MLLEQRVDVSSEEVRHLRLVVAAQPAHELARDAPARVCVGALDVSPDVIERVLVERLLIRLVGCGALSIGAGAA